MSTRSSPRSSLAAPEHAIAPDPILIVSASKEIRIKLATLATAAALALLGSLPNPASAQICTPTQGSTP
jgi:hypothetical protein